MELVNVTISGLISIVAVPKTNLSVHVAGSGQREVGDCLMGRSTVGTS
jgi:hypothetical protein